MRQCLICSSYWAQIGTLIRSLEFCDRRNSIQHISQKSVSSLFGAEQRLEGTDSVEWRKDCKSIFIGASLVRGYKEAASLTDSPKPIDHRLVRKRRRFRFRNDKVHARNSTLHWNMFRAIEAPPTPPLIDRHSWHRKPMRVLASQRILFNLLVKFFACYGASLRRFLTNRWKLDCENK